jgi:hypothetical protein
MEFTKKPNPSKDFPNALEHQNLFSKHFQSQDHFAWVYLQVCKCEHFDWSALEGHLEMSVKDLTIDLLSF